MVNVQSTEFNTYKAEQDKIIGALNKTIDELKNCNSLLLERIKALENVKSSSAPTSTSWANVVSGSAPLKKSVEQLHIMNAVAAETKEREKRENNVIVFGITASKVLDTASAKEEDKKLILDMFSSINSNIEPKQIIKLKSKSDKEHPFVVVLNNKKERNSILKAAKILKSSSRFSNAFINPDLTEAERYNAKLLRDECKKLNLENAQPLVYYYGICNDRVVKIVK